MQGCLRNSPLVVLCFSLIRPVENEGQSRDHSEIGRAETPIKSAITVPPIAEEEMRSPSNKRLGKGKWALSDFEHLLDHATRIGKLLVLDVLGIDRRRINGTDSLDGGIEIIESVLLNQGRDL